MLEELYLIRHAAPDRTTGVPYRTMPGPSLTAIGQQEAVQTAYWLGGRGIERLLASPFDRTRATAEPIAAQLGLEITFTEALREGAPGETLEQIRARMAELLAQLEDSPLRVAALVSHGAPIQMLLRHTTGDRIDLKPHTYDNGNCAPTAGVWHGRRGDNCWVWELAFRPSASVVQL
ncbi:MAG TPA: histidine phosphatase family protein [Roseiflexaceae bacterium]|nr:histidine phosphatase family protein [Roseiflexaceae bacterium]